MKQKKRARSPLRTVLTVVLLAVFCVSAWQVVSQLIQDKREADAFEDLIAQLGEDDDSLVPAPDDEAPDDTAEPSDGQPSSQEGEDDDVYPGIIEGIRPPAKNVLARYQKLHERNPDLFGWIRIDGTKINYPVMHTPEDPEYYLRRAFDGSYSRSGVPFLDGACFEDCGNYIVYGHDMKNGTMFACLLNYADKSFWEEHPVIRFDTIEEKGEYEVMAAFYSKAYRQTDEGVFRYYYCQDLTDPDDFASYTEQVAAAALYKTGVEASYGDQLLTLSTCSYHTTNGRFVVVARKKA